MRGEGGRDRVGVTLLGDVAVVGPSRAVRGPELGGQQAILALAQLTLSHGRLVQSDELAETLWPESLPPTWSAALRVAVSKARRALSRAGLPASIAHAGEGYRLSGIKPPLTDVAAAEGRLTGARRAAMRGDRGRALRDARAAAAALGSSFLPGIDRPWCDDIRYDLHAKRLEALELTAELTLAAGGVEESVEASTSALSADPFRESAHRLLIRAHLEAGNFSLARLAMDRCRSILADELGLPPSPATAALDEEIERRRRPRPRPRPGEDRSVPPPLRSLVDTPLVGRTDALVRLDELLAEAAGQRRVGLVTGDAGIGKTRLLSEVAARGVAAGDLVLFGSCTRDSGMPYQAVAEAIESWVAAMPASERRARLRSLPPVLGRLSVTIDGVLTKRSPRQDDSATHLAQAVGAVIRAEASGRRVVLLIDDLHWADSGTLQVLTHAVQGLADVGLLLVVSYRPADLSQDTARTIIEWERRATASRFELGELGEDEIAQLAEAVRGVRPSAQATADLRGRTGGNPFFVIETLRTDGRAVPDTVQALVRSRLQDLGRDARATVEIAAVASPPVRALVISEVIGERGDALEGLERAQRAGLLQPVPGDLGSFTFPHALVRDAVLTGLSPVRQAQLHEQIAAALCSTGLAVGDPVTAARHLLSAGALVEPARLMAWSRAAGQRMLDALAPESAVAWFEIAIEASERAGADPAVRCDLDIGLAQALRRADDPRGRDQVLVAAARARELGDPERLARAVIPATQLTVGQRVGAVDCELVAALEEAQRLLPGDLVALRAQVLSRLAFEHAWAPDIERTLQFADDAERLARACGEPATRAAVLSAIDLAASVPERLEQRRTWAAELTATGTLLRDDIVRCRGLFLALDTSIEAGDPDGFRAARSELQDHAPGLTGLQRWDLLLRTAALEAATGDLASARDRAAGITDLAAQTGIDAEMALATQGFVSLPIEGDLGMWDAIADAAGFAADHQPHVGEWQGALALAAASAGRQPVARRALRAAVRFGLRRNLSLLVIGTMLARAAYLLDDAESGRAVRRLLAPWEGRMAWVTTTCGGPVDLALGLLDLVDHDVASARRRFTAGASLAESFGFEPWLLRCRLGLAAAAASAGDRDGAAAQAEAVASRARARGFIDVALRADDISMQASRRYATE